MIKTDRIDVYMNNRHVGTMAETKHRAAFQYSDEWIETGFPISPLSLPLEKRLFIPEYSPFEGVYGVFADTLLVIVEAVLVLLQRTWRYRWT